MSFNLAAYTLAHVVISLVGIGSGIVVLGGLLTRKWLDRWTALFLTTTLATSLTGYGFPVEHVFAVPHRGRDLDRRVGVIQLRALRSSSRRELARDVRDRRCHRPLLECVRSRGPIVPQGAGAQGTGANAVRATLRSHATDRAGAIGSFGRLGDQTLEGRFARVSCGQPNATNITMSPAWHD